jgi:hypothetical protein
MEPLMRHLFSLMMIVGSLAFTEKSFGAETISAAEIQHFEQTYESWAQEIVHNINPNLKFTVISEIQFSERPSQIAAYEEMKLSQHLPGMPEMTDPNYSHPMDSPLFALVARKKIRIIFHTPINPVEQKVIDEVIRAKMKIAGLDSLKIEDQDSSFFKMPKIDRKAASVLITLFAALSLIGSSVLAARQIRRRKSAKKIQPAASKDSKVAAPPVPVHEQILAGNPVIRRSALKKERTEVIARASLNCSKRFSNELLGELDQAQFDLVNQWLLKAKKTVTPADSNYSRFLLAARIKQAQNEKLIESLQTFKGAHPRGSHPSSSEASL